MQLSDSIKKVQAAAERLGLAINLREMATSTRTAEDAAAACGVGAGQIVKSLLFRGADSKTPYLLLVSGTNRVNEAGVARDIGERLERPDGRHVRDVTGFAIGGVPPFGHATALTTYIDRDLLDYDLVWAAAGTPNAVFSVDPRLLQKALAATTIPMT